MPNSGVNGPIYAGRDDFVSVVNQLLSRLLLLTPLQGAR
jgi:hypothetical protein